MAVPGEGPISSKIMFVGEAPGREEDLSGRPFVGRSGKFLTKLVEAAGLKRDKCFITSVIKHRPPKNRKPKRNELEACKIWWQKQIEILNPRLIVLLGRTASDTVLGKDFWINRARIFKKDKRSFFITYHPAAGIRFVKMEKILEKDFKKLKGF